MRTFIVIILLSLAGCVTTTTGGNPVTPDSKQMAEGYYKRGQAYFIEKNYELAAVEFHRSLQTDSSNKWSYYYLGIISDYQDRLNDSIPFYKEAISIDSNFSEAYNALGAAYSRQQKWNEALKAFNRALDNKLYTTPHIPYLNMGRVYMAQKEYDKAITAYRDAKRFSNQDYIFIELGTALMEAGRTKEAVSEFQDDVKLFPQNASLRYNLALAYLKDGKKKAAMSEFKAAADMAPNSEISTKANEYIKKLR
jgi:type IV pilus assembly protein PilF